MPPLVRNRDRGRNLPSATVLWDGKAQRAGQAESQETWVLGASTQYFTRRT
jgi:hypothetical protein